MALGLPMCSCVLLSHIALCQRCEAPRKVGGVSLLQLSDSKSSFVRILTVETRNPNGTIPVPGVPGWSFQNIGAGQEWQGWISKVGLPARYFEQRARVRPDEIIILADSADVLSGGCTAAELLRRYRAIVGAHGPRGPSVVFGAQFRVFPPEALNFSIYPGLAERRDAVLSRLGLNRSSFGSVLWEERCKRDRLDLCQWPRAYDKLNAGFVMGPVGALHRVFSQALLLPHSKTDSVSMVNRSNIIWNDQLAFAVYMSEHPEEVTVDYGGLLTAELVYSRGMLRIEGGVLRSQVHGAKQCFAHGNGNGCSEWKRLLRLLDPEGAARSRDCHSHEEPPRAPRAA